MRHSQEDDSSSVGDDELVHPPVFIAPVRQVSANDDGDLSGPVAGGCYKYMRVGGPGSTADGTDCVQNATKKKSGQQPFWTMRVLCGKEITIKRNFLHSRVGDSGSGNHMRVGLPSYEKEKEVWRDTGKAKCGRKRGISTDRRRPCLIQPTPLHLFPPNPLPTGLTPEQTKDL